MSFTYGGTSIGGNLRGDGNPTKFKFNTIITNEELLALYELNPALEKAVRWIPSILMGTGWEFKEDLPFEGEKFGNPHTYESFNEWFMWCGAYEEVLNAIAWANLFRKSRIFFYMPDEEPIEYKGKNLYGEIQQNEDVCTRAEAMYPLINGNGWEIEEIDDDGNPIIYKIHKTNRETSSKQTHETKIHYIHASRVVEFHGPKKKLGLEGSSKAQSVAHLCQIQQQLLNSVFYNVKNLQAGYLVCRADNEKTVDYLNEIYSEFSHLTRIYWGGQEDLNDVVQIVVPDFRVDQLERINLLIQKRLASASNISIRTLGEEDIASGIGEGGAGISHELTKLEIKQNMRFYQRSIEHCLYLMGKKNTSFVWKEPLVRDEEIIEEERKEELLNTPKSNILEEIEEDILIEQEVEQELDRRAEILNGRRGD